MSSLDPKECMWCGGLLKAKTLSSINVPHRVLDRVPISNVPVLFCEHCDDIFYGKEFINAIDQQYRKQMLERAKFLMSKLEEHGIDLFEFERSLGFDVGEIEDGEPDERKVSLICAAAFALIKTPYPQKCFQEYITWLNNPMEKD